MLYFKASLIMMLCINKFNDIHQLITKTIKKTSHTKEKLNKLKK